MSERQVRDWIVAVLKQQRGPQALSVEASRETKRAGLWVQMRQPGTSDAPGEWFFVEVSRVEIKEEDDRRGV